jgi:hypothetical protein
VNSFTVDCHSGAYGVYALFAAVFIVIYPIGIIAIFVALLYLNRHALGEDGGGGEHEDWWSGSVETFDFLVDGYRRGTFWYEILEFIRCGRRHCQQQNVSYHVIMTCSWAVTVLLCMLA